MVECRTVNSEVVGSRPTRPANYKTTTRESIIMNMTAEPAVVEENKEYILSPIDRCDQCYAEALVLVKGVTGQLMFCGHHYAKNEKALSVFAYETIDERDKLKENKATEPPHA